MHRDRVVAAAHLLRYGTDDRVGDQLRGAGELRWFVFWPGQHPTAAAESNRVADALAGAAVAALRRAGVRAVLADFGLPAPGVYGVPAVWPHVAGALQRCGFVPGERQEVVLVAERGTDCPGAARRRWPGSSWSCASAGTAPASTPSWTAG